MIKDVKKTIYLSLMVVQISVISSNFLMPLINVMRSIYLTVFGSSLFLLVLILIYRTLTKGIFNKLVYLIVNQFLFSVSLFFEWKATSVILACFGCIFSLYVSIRMFRNSVAARSLYLCRNDNELKK